MKFHSRFIANALPFLRGLPQHYNSLERRENCKDVLHPLCCKPVTRWRKVRNCISAQGILSFETSEIEMRIINVLIRVSKNSKVARDLASELNDVNYVPCLIDVGQPHVCRR